MTIPRHENKGMKEREREKSNKKGTYQLSHICFHEKTDYKIESIWHYRLLKKGRKAKNKT